MKKLVNFLCVIGELYKNDDAKREINMYVLDKLCINFKLS